MGRYAFEKIGSATYVLTATLPGFRNQQVEGIVVTADTTTTVDLTLKVEWYDDLDLGFRDGATIETALQQLRDIYKRYSR